MLPSSELDTLRKELLLEFDYWAAHGLGDGVTVLQIDVHSYRKIGERVRSMGKRDPKREANELLTRG